MRSIKLGGLTAAALLIAVAAFAASSASATALCKVTGAVCPENEPYPTNTTLKGTLVTATKAVLTTDIVGALECEEADWTAESTTDQNSEVTGGAVSVFTLNACENAPVACPLGVTVTGVPYSMGVQATTAGNGRLRFAAGKGPPGVAVNCGIMECTFTFGELPLEVTGGATAIAKINTSKMEWKGKKCPATAATFTVEYKITTPAPLFIASEVAPPLLCKENKGPCPAGKSYGTGTTIKAELEKTVKFVYTLNGTKKEPTCPSSKIVGKTTGAGRPIVGEITEWIFPGGCGGGLCETTALHLPYRFEIERSGKGNGTISWLSNGSGGPSVKIKCGLLEDCTYGTSSFTFELEGSLTAPKFYWPKKISLKGEAGALCSATATLEGIGGSEEVPFKFTEPTALFVTS
jgi:hypothetical protein